MSDEGSTKCRCEKPGHCFWHHSVVDELDIESCGKGSPPSRTDDPCVYLEDRTNKTIGEQHVYRCMIHETTVLNRDEEQQGIVTCEDCKDRARRLQMPRKFRDPLEVTDRNRNKTDALRNMLNGGGAFLVCGGPSIKQVAYQKLAERGIFSLGVNNVCGYVPVSAFVCSDPPSKFWDGIYKDPKIMKFLPKPKLRRNRNKLRRKVNGEFREIKLTTSNTPNTWGFERRSWLVPDETWFLNRGAAWGNHQAGVEKTGEEKTVCTMLLGLRLLQYLGARRIFLLGCDFHMDPGRDAKGNYSFGEKRDGGACRSNNNIYRVVGVWLAKLRPVFEKYGFECYNCFDRSHLRAFDYVPFEDALEICRRVPSEKPDLTGWYEK